MGLWELSVLLTFLLNQNYTIIKSLTNTINFRSTFKPSEASITVFTVSIHGSPETTEIVVLYFSPDEIALEGLTGRGDSGVAAFWLRCVSRGLESSLHLQRA